MAIAYFPSRDDADVIEVAFADIHGGTLNLNLFVDSGFTGSSSFVLPGDIGNIGMPAGFPISCLRCDSRRPVASHCAVRHSGPFLSNNRNRHPRGLTPLGLPTGVQGVVGLPFLRRFRGWGAEKVNDGSWRFFLESESA